MRSIAAKGGVVQIVAYTGFLKLDPARDAAEKALESETARQAGDAEFDSAKHEYLPAHQAGLERLDRSTRWRRSTTIWITSSTP